MPYNAVVCTWTGNKGESAPGMILSVCMSISFGTNKTISSRKMFLSLNYGSHFKSGGSIWTTFCVGQLYL